MKKLIVAIGLIAALTPAHALEFQTRVQPWYPDARIIAVPPGLVPQAAPAARARWNARCKPRLFTDRLGVDHWVYSAVGCEFGPGLKDGH